MSFSGTKGYITKPKPGVILNPLHPLSKGLVGYWLFNEGSGSLANDISGHGNHGTLKNTSPNAQGSGWGGSQFGMNLQLDGVNDYVNVPDSNSLDVNSFTLTCWFKDCKTYAVTDAAGLINKFQAVAGGRSYSLLLYYPAGAFVQPYAYISHTGDTSVVLASNYNISGLKNQWTHLALTFNNGDFVYYVNGMNVSSDHVAITTLYNNSEPVKIGMDYTTRGFNGPIGLASIYTQAKSPAEIKQLYHDPFCNLLQVPMRRYSVVTPIGAIMNQFQTHNVGADLYNGVIIA